MPGGGATTPAGHADHIIPAWIAMILGLAPRPLQRCDRTRKVMNTGKLMSDRRFYVYGYYDPQEDGLPFYIGKGTGGRLYLHFCPSYLGRRTMFYDKLRGMLARGVRPDVRVLHHGLFEGESHEIEVRLIAEYGRRDNGT